jgi:outer membrane PBP1 activator LpoA protein
MQLRKANTRLLAGLGLLCLSVVLSGCPSTGVRPTGAPKADVAAAERLAREGKPRDAAQMYESLASQATGTQQVSYYLAAARQWMAAGAYPEAQRVLTSIAAAATGKQATEHALLSAELALAEKNPPRALEILKRLGTPTDPHDLASALALQGRAQFAMGDAVSGVKTLTARERGLQGSAAIDENRRMIVAGLRDAATRGAPLTVPKGADPVLAGWLQFGSALHELDRNPFAGAAALRAWRSRYPLHPANGRIMDELLSESTVGVEYPAQVALMLPLGGRQQAAATAVRDGFLSAYFQQDAAQRPRVRIYDVANADVGSAVLKAIDEGAQFIVGPLTKDEVAAASAIADGRVPVLALNFLADGSAVPPSFFQFALAPEDEARQVAHRVIADGHPRGVALVPSGEWGNRVAAAFSEELELSGGQLIARGTYSPSESDYTVAIQQLLRLSESRDRYAKLVSTLGTKLEFEPRRRGDIGFIFVAAQAANSRLIRPQLRFHYAGDIPTYSTSDAYEPDEVANVDLEGVMFPDMPWMIGNDPVSEQLRSAVRSAWPARANRRGRLYAFGFDAYRLIPSLRNPQANRAAVVSGMTGRLSIDANGRIRRDLDWAQMHDGRPRALALGGTATPTGTN